MAIYQTQGFVVNFTGDGVSTTFDVDVVGYIDPKITPKVPSTLLLLQSNIGGSVSGTMVGTTITVTFSTAPAAVSGQLSVTLGF